MVRASDSVVAGGTIRSLWLGAGIVGLVLLVSLGIGWLTPGFQGDINQNKSWARTLVRSGMHEAYRGSIDYPPLPLYVFAGAGWVYQSSIDRTWNERAALASHEFTFLMKVPVIVAHAGVTGLLFALGIGLGARTAGAVALGYGLNPATLYDIAHFGQTDSLLGLFALAAMAAALGGRGLLAGASAVLLLFTKPQGWVLLPVIGLVCLMRFRGPRSWLALTTAGVVTALVLVSPWLLSGRPHHLWRFLDNLNAHALSNRVISADAHNLWWIPTLLYGDWIEDAAPLLGALSYRSVALVLAGAWLVGCLAVVVRRPNVHPLVVSAAVSFGFFMLMVRAHENHGYLAIPLLLGAYAAAPSRAVLVLVSFTSLGLLMNLVLRDPFVMGPYTSVPDAGHEAPAIVVALQSLNVLINALTLLLIGRALVRGWTRA